MEPLPTKSPAGHQSLQFEGTQADCGFPRKSALDFPGNQVFPAANSPAFMGWSSGGALLSLQWGLGSHGILEHPSWIKLSQTILRKLRSLAFPQIPHDSELRGIHQGFSRFRFISPLCLGRFEPTPSTVSSLARG